MVEVKTWTCVCVQMTFLCLFSCFPEIYFIGLFIPLFLLYMSYFWYAKCTGVLSDIITDRTKCIIRWRSKLDNCGGGGGGRAHIRIFEFTDHENRRF